MLVTKLFLRNVKPCIISGNLLKVTDPIGNVTEYTYDIFGNKLTEKDPNGNVTAYTYDKNNNILTDIKTLYIDDLCVDETKRGMHIGRNLYAYVLDFAKKSGCYNVTLNVWECNKKAKGFYENLGMEVQKTYMEKVL